ncbi:MAG TPA: hypothetical protein DCR93_26080 [Cytophagales bacterium]|nr:hypothetical protein [Cytophagales bacterium]HAP62816.1 hypothetical protein [Cytophagales bacterium]
MASFLGETGEFFDQWHGGTLGTFLKNGTFEILFQLKLMNHESSYLRLAQPLILLGFWVFSLTLAQAQDLSNLDEGPNFKVSGGLNVNQVFYATTSDVQRRDPYNYFLGGNISVSAFGLSVPLSFSYSNQNFSFSQPFNQYGLQPTYKWIRGYIGYNSLNFSKYTLAGHIFNGVGVEVNPDLPFSATVMYGRLRQAVPLNSEEANAQPSYRRMGWGVKLAYTPNGDKYELSLFGAADDTTSLFIDPRDSLVPPDLKPQQNVALGINIAKRIGDRFNLTLEYGNSSLTRDLRSPKVESRTLQQVYQPVRYLNGLSPRKTSTAYYQAIKGGFSANLTVLTLGVGYERIDPGYATLGAYFFNADLENLTANVSTSLFDNRVNIAINGGGQRNNLDNEQASSTSRFVGSASVSGQVSERLKLNLNYSNFQTFARVQSRDQFAFVNSLSEFDSVNVDTLTFVQVNQSGSLSASYVLSTNKDHPMALVMNASYSGSSERDNEEAPSATFYNLSTAYSYKNQANGLGITAAANATVTVQDTLRTTQFGPTVSANKSFFEKTLKLNASISANRSLSNAAGASGWLNNFRISGNYQLRERHQFRLNTTVLNRPKPGEASGRQTEFTANLGYSFSF